jgi:hypothetical protein
VPLKAGWSKAVIAANVARGRREGKSASVASAAAYRRARQWYRRLHPRGPWPGHLDPAPPRRPAGRNPATTRVVSAQDIAKNYKPVMDEIAVSQMADIAARRARAEKNRESGMSLRKAREAAAEAKATPEIRAVIRQRLLRGATNEQAIRAAIRIGKWSKSVVTAAHNPAPDAEMERAARAYQAFHGERPKEILQLDIPSAPRTAVALGECLAVIYRGRRDGKTYSFKHTFARRARPYLCFSSDGRQLFLLGGDFKVTDRGIVDREK